jgi:hypothetical protein
VGNRRDRLSSVAVIWRTTFGHIVAPKSSAPHTKLWNIRMARLRLSVIVAMTLSTSILAHAGTPSLIDEDLSGRAYGPPFIGFVREVGGGGINDAKVTATLKGGALVTATDILGLYKMPGFGKDVDPGDVIISCAKDGYTQASVVRRPHATADVRDPVEVDCYLQKR